MKRFAAYFFLVILPIVFIIVGGKHKAKAEKLAKFEKCIEAHPSDAVCDSCWTLIMDNTVYMNKEEAIQKLRSGFAVTHRYFTTDEFIYMVDNLIYDETGACHGTLDDFFALRPERGWDIYWSIYNNEKK